MIHGKYNVYVFIEDNSSGGDSARQRLKRHPCCFYKFLICKKIVPARYSVKRGALAGAQKNKNHILITHFLQKSHFYGEPEKQVIYL